MTSTIIGEKPHVSCLVVDADTVRHGGDAFRRVRKRRAGQDYESMEDGVPDCRTWLCECGERFPFWRGGIPSYCPVCGAEVVRR